MKILLFIFLTSLSPSLFAMQEGSVTTEHGTRKYFYYAPKGLRKNAPMMVALHGCYMSPQQLASGTGLNDYAQKFGFAILYPEQTFLDNPWRCWNWFKPENLRRNDGELQIIVEMTRQLTLQLQINAQQIYVVGLSAGGAMASNLLACYADVFAGGMIHSGLEFHAAQSEAEAHQVTKNGPTQDLQKSAELAFSCSPKRKKLIPVLIVHGDSDPFVNKINSHRAAEQFVYLNSLIAQHASLPGVITNSDYLIPSQQPYGFSAKATDTLVDGKIIVRKILVEGMGHGWSGGQTASPYMEPRGINVNEILIQFWLKR